MNKQKGSPRFAPASTKVAGEAGLAPILIVLLIALVFGGYLLYQKQNKPIIPQPVTQSLPSPVTSPIASSSAETTNPDLIRANWKTYVSPSLNYSLKYPQKWNVVKIPDSPGISITPTDQETIIIVPDSRISSDYISDTTKAIVQKQIKVNGLDAIEYIVTYKANISTIHIGDTFTKTVITNKDKPNLPILVQLSNLKYKDIYNQILSTFKFTQ